MAGLRHLLPLASLLVAACGVATPARVATVRNAAVPAVLALDPAGPEDASAPALAGTFRSGLNTALAARNVRIEAESRYRLAIGFAVRPADAGVGQIDGATMDWTSEPRRHRWYHVCRAQRVDAVVALRDSASGEVIGRWRGGFDHCAPGEAQVNSLAGRFAQAITNR